MTHDSSVMRAEEDPAAIVRRGYDRLGARFAEWASKIDQPLREEYVMAVTTDLAPGAVVVELGCGPAATVGRALAGRLHYVGVDLSPEMLRLARQNIPHASLVQADIADIAFRPQCLDAVVSFYSIIHVPREKHAQVFSSIAAWLRPGGRFAASLGARDHPSEVHEWLGEVEMYWSFFAPETTLGLLADAGFEIERSLVAEQVEDDKLVPFLWVQARRA